MSVFTLGGVTMQPSARLAHLGLLAVATVFLSSITLLGYRAYERQSSPRPDDFRLSLAPDGTMIRRVQNTPFASIPRRDAKPQFSLAQGR